MGKLGINSHPAGIRFSPVSMNCELIGININRYIFYNYNFLLTESSLHTPDPDSTEEVTILLTSVEPAENEDLDDLLKTLMEPTTPQQPETSVINASTGGQVVSSTELVMCRAITIGEDYQTASTNQEDFKAMFEAAVPEAVVPEDIKPPAIHPIVQQIQKVVVYSDRLNNYHVKSGGKFTISLKASSEFLKKYFFINCRYTPHSTDTFNTILLQIFHTLIRVSACSSK